jgi:hypothetical protein
MIVLANDHTTEVTPFGGSSEDLWIRSDELMAATGFELKPHGACLGELCVPLFGDDQETLLTTRDDGEWLNMSGLASKLGQKTVCDRSAAVWSLGPIPAVRQSTLESGLAPDFEIVDRNGDVVRLSDLRGKKVLILTWASW